MKNTHPVPDYVGRILSSSGVPQGTCFQLAPGYLVTAWHVVQGTLALGDDEVLTVDRLRDPGADRITARVLAEDRKADLALLAADAAFPGSARLLRGSRSVAYSEPVTVVGHALMYEAAGTPPVVWVEALGEWQGEVRRTDDVTLGRFHSRDVLPGMSGAPVRQRSDDSVVGVVSARYNTADGWLANSVWAGRADDLRTLCAGRVDLDASRWAGFPATAAAAGGGAAAAVAEDMLRKRRDDPVIEVRTESAPVPAPGREPGEPVAPAAPAGTGTGAADMPVTGGSGESVSDAVVEEVTQGALERVTRWILDYL
ncbi:trypsin-like peptidase domain-containing protein [Streptomyces sp. CMB-StM0423]|uniref:trypsin-like peptidase domain-containing protein n=1 Tax=Streptomyces sp. CMB-StM0423 TaxID=2059884 RepID=UPI00131BA2B2|nr:trypsin-like peptidase domain-containing protein [Streptomyces sp. CMB-StM0423]